MASLLLSRDEVRDLDRRALEELGLPGVLLMENAGRGAAEILMALGIHGPVVFCCGKGNNGGDGFVMARHLSNWNIAVHVLLFAPPERLTGDAATNYRVIAKGGLPVTVFEGDAVDSAKLNQQLATAEWVVDALFGTGLKGAVRSPFDAVIRCMNASVGRVFALDIPSGLDCDTGQPTEPTVRAAHTATFAAIKKGFVNPCAREWLGELHLVDIGVLRVLLENLKSGRSP